MDEHQGSKKIQERLIRIDELIELLGEKSKQAVYNKINRKDLHIPTYRIGRSLRWKFSEVSEFITKLQPMN
jgi:predicted DNA-binding transcriptional regulator AlpA